MRLALALILIVSLVLGGCSPTPPAAPQLQATFLNALSALVGRWLLVRWDAPEMDLVTVMCRARGYIERGGAEQSKGKAWTR
jgi:hypothetical protein